MNNEEELLQLKNKIASINEQLKETIDFSIGLRSNSEMKKRVNLIWQTFLSDFYGYVRQRSRETKENLLASISFPRIW